MNSSFRTTLGLSLTLLSLGTATLASDSAPSFYRTEASLAAPRAIVLGYLAERAADLGVTAGDVADVAIVREFRSRHNGVTHFALRQRVNGLEVDGTELSVAVDSRGRLFHPAGELLAGLASRAAENSRSPQVGPDGAIIAAARQLGQREVDGLDLVDSDRAAVDRRAVFTNPVVSDVPIEARLRYLRLADDRLRLTWNLALKAPGDANWWNVWIDADSGTLLRRDNWTNDVDTYSVFPLPLESPLDSGGVRTDEVDPWQAGGTTLPDGASPFGWHDTDADIDPDFTDSRGNNVEAQTDLDANNTFGGSDIRASGGALPDLDFLPALDLTLGPDTYREAAVVNLFYWNNIMHDVAYQYGFDEAAGNFQVNNYGRGGTGLDPVQADAQDGSGTNNANFSTPPDGLSPRMQMFVWSAPQNIHETAPTDISFPAGAASGWAQVSFTLAQTLVFINDGQGPDVNDGCCATANGRCTPAPAWGVAGQIALLRRGNCEFGVKGLNAQDAGAVGTIIINNGSNGVAPMGAGSFGASVTTPVQMIGRANGNGIVAELAGGPVSVTMESTALLPNRDSDLDAGIIAHEYGHGISNRLTGTGPGCLGNQEQMGEGWSDWMTLFLNADAADTATTERSVGGYVSFEPANTAGYIGIRRFPYTTDNAVNADTYATVATFPLNTTGNPIPVHNIGSVWAVMLWEMYWSLVAVDGFDPDFYFGTGGNNVAFQLVMDGLATQPCSPGFVTARDAILASDVADYDGDHECAIWIPFAERGLGFGANQGSSASYTDGVAAFALPAVCVNHIFSSSFGHGDLSHWSSSVP